MPSKEPLCGDELTGKTAGGFKRLIEGALLEYQFPKSGIFTPPRGSFRFADCDHVVGAEPVELMNTFRRLIKYVLLWNQTNFQAVPYIAHLLVEVGSMDREGVEYHDVARLVAWAPYAKGV